MLFRIFSYYFFYEQGRSPGGTGFRERISFSVIETLVAWISLKKKLVEKSPDLVDNMEQENTRTRAIRKQ